MVNTGGIAGEQLRNYIEKIERLEEEKKGIAEEIREIYASAKATGFDPKVMRACVRLRKQDPAERQEAESLLDVYMHALGDGAVYDRHAEVTVDVKAINDEVAPQENDVQTEEASEEDFSNVVDMSAPEDTDIADLGEESLIDKESDDEALMSDDLVEDQDITANFNALVEEGSGASASVH